jgi:hypothetical protein
VALSVILGRPLRDDEFPALMGDLINSAYARGEDGGRESLPSGLREWLRRALEVDVRHSFKSVTEAQNALDQLASLDVKDHADVDDLQAFLDQCRHPAKKPLVMPPSVAKATSIAAAPPPRSQERPIEKPREEQPRDVEANAQVEPRRPVRGSARRAWIAAGVMSAMAAGVGLFAARQGFSTEPPALPAAPISLPAAARPPQVAEVPAPPAAALQAPVNPSVVPEPAATDQIAKIEPGWVSVAAPFDMELYEQGKLLGTTGIDRIMLPAGRHDIEVVSEALGYREPHTVNVQPNKVASISITLPKGTISLNAIPWATVSIDGENAGDTPIGNLALTIGPHEVVFTNPQLGEQRRVITVTQRSPVRFSIDLTKK